MRAADQDAHEAAERLRLAVLFADAHALRSSLERLHPSMQGDISERARAPFPVLRRAPDPAAYLRRIPVGSAIWGRLAHALSDGCLRDTRAALGDHADDPTRTELAAALDSIADTHQASTVRVLLALAAAEGWPAAGICTDLLESEPRYRVPDEATLPRQAAAVPLPAKPVPTKAPETLEARRARKEEERRQRRAAADKRRRPPPAPRRPREARQGAEFPPGVSPPDGERPAPEVPAIARRRPSLTPEQARAFDPDHELVGAVVWADFPFDVVDDQGCRSKRRPCVVVGVSRRDLLVRPCYSEGGFNTKTWKAQPLRHPEKAGLDRRVRVGTKTRRVSRTHASPPIGRLTVEDWNGLW